MKAFYVTWSTNYGFNSAVIEAENIDNCKRICEESDFIWKGYMISEIEKTNTEHIIFLGDD